MVGMTGKPVRTRRSPLWAKVSLGLGLVLMVSGGLGVVGTRLFGAVAFHSVRQETLLGGAGQQAEQRGHVEITGAKTILLVGIDSRPDQRTSDLVRSDSIIVAHIPATHDGMYLVSIPRDTYVTIPAFNNGVKRHAAGGDRINAAYAYGGDGLTGKAARAKAVELLALTIKKAYGITFDGAAIVDFNGFRNAVEALGGVWMNVDQETTSVHIGFTKDGTVKVPFRQVPQANGSTKLIPIAGVTPQRYHVGPQHLDPHQALDYVRQRELLPNSDYDRQRHQQQFIKAIIKQTASRETLTNPVKLAKVVDALGSAMTIDSGGIDLTDWVYAMKGIGAEQITTLKTNNGTFRASTESSGAEALDQNTLTLLAAVRDDTVATFVAAHLDLVTQS